MHRPLGRATWVVLAPFAFVGAQAHLAAAYAGGLRGYAMVRFGFSCLAHFGRRQKFLKGGFKVCSFCLIRLKINLRSYPSHKDSFVSICCISSIRIPYHLNVRTHAEVIVNLDIVISFQMAFCLCFQIICFFIIV